MLEKQPAEFLLGSGGILRRRATGWRVMMGTISPLYVYIMFCVFKEINVMVKSEKG